MLESSLTLVLVSSLGTIFGVFLSYWVQWLLLSDREAWKMADVSTPFLHNFRTELARADLTVDAEAIEFLRGRIDHARAAGILERYEVPPASMGAASVGAGLAFAAIVRREARKAKASNVSAGLVKRILDFLCPGFFPIC